jgi:organic radical activating enzyme
MNLVEIFASAQGEGLHVGASTIFVRLGECDLRCSWCDSPGTWLPAKRWRYETGPGTADFVEHANPASLSQVEDALEQLDAKSYRFVSVTGGEPLLQVESVEAIARIVREMGSRTLLETHGLAVGAMERVAPLIDVVSMDWKLAKDVRWAAEPEAGEDVSFDSRHEAFLIAALQHCEVYVKVVVTAQTTTEELESVARQVASVDASVPLVLQPVTPTAKVREAPTASQMLPHMRECERILKDVRLIPQTHKVYGAL